jgi:hypothetical protein
MNRIRGAWSGSGALPRSLSWFAGVLSTLPNPSWLDPGASDRVQHLALQTRTSHHMKKRFWSILWWSGTGKNSISCVCCRMQLLYLTLQARYLHCSGCHFELKQLGFTAAYRARQCLLTTINTFILILRARILQPHRSESRTWHNRDFLQRHVLTDRARSRSCCDGSQVATRSSLAMRIDALGEFFAYRTRKAISPQLSDWMRASTSTS